MRIGNSYVKLLFLHQLASLKLYVPSDESAAKPKEYEINKLYSDQRNTTLIFFFAKSFYNIILSLESYSIKSLFTLEHHRKGRGREDRVPQDFDSCNCSCISFTKLRWPGEIEGTFRSSSQAAPVCYTRRLRTVPLIAEPQAGKL